MKRVEIVRGNCRLRAAALLAGVLLAGALAGQAVCAELEIPLQELKKVQKKPAKKSTAKKKESKKTAKPEKHSSEKADAAAAAPVQAAAEKPTAVAEEGAASISHSPYSFVAPGKGVKLSAVIGSRDEIQSVRCQYRAAGGNYEQIPMNKAESTRFTYAVTLPALPAEARELQYRLIVTEQGGRTTRSQEFSIPVRQTTIVPGWQE